jgi:hypothetical protein
VTEAICLCPYDFNYMRTAHFPDCPVLRDNPNALVNAQIAGEPLPVEFVAPPAPIITDADKKTADEIFLAGIRQMGKTPDDGWLLSILAKHRTKNVDNAPETNFGFYVDGFTLHSTDNVEEIRAVAFDGRETTFPTKQLVAFLDRRLSPPNINPEN